MKVVKELTNSFVFLSPELLQRLFLAAERLNAPFLLSNLVSFDICEVSKVRVEVYEERVKSEFWVNQSINQ